MDYSKSFAVSAAGMASERTRVEVASLNLANANTTVSATQGYRALRSVVHAVPLARGEPFADLVGPDLLAPQARVEVSPQPARRVLDQGHPLADADGFVSYPAVDTPTEMVGLMGALRAYEANVAAMNAARTISLKALEIGGAS